MELLVKFLDVLMYFNQFVSIISPACGRGVGGIKISFRRIDVLALANSGSSSPTISAIWRLLNFLLQ